MLAAYYRPVKEQERTMAKGTIKSTTLPQVTVAKGHRDHCADSQFRQILYYIILKMLPQGVFPCPDDHRPD